MAPHGAIKFIGPKQDAAIYLSRKWIGLSLKEIGSEFGLKKYSSVSSIVGRMEKQLQRNKELLERLELIKKKQKPLPLM